MSFLLNSLRTSTQHLHHALEKISYSSEIMSRQLSLNQYEDLIQKNYLIYEKIEPLFNRSLSKLGGLYEEHFISNRLDDLEKDLVFLSGEYPRGSINIPFITLEEDPIVWLGVLYVLEGSRLGGNMIFKALKNNSFLNGISNFYFYKQENVDIRNRWITLKNTFDNCVINKQEEELINRGANATFNYFYQIHQQNISSPTLNVNS